MEKCLSAVLRQSMFISLLHWDVLDIFSLTSSTQNALVSLNRLMDVAKMQSESDGKQIVSNIKAIYLQDISLSFDKPVLKSFNAAFYKGNIYALCGDNGTGNPRYYI